MGEGWGKEEEEEEEVGGRGEEEEVVESGWEGEKVWGEAEERMEDRAAMVLTAGKVFSGQSSDHPDSIHE